MNPLKKLYYAAASVLPTRWFHSGGPQRLLLPYHHVVSNQQLEHIGHLYAYKNEKQFTQDLDFLLKNYSPVSAADVFAAVKSNQPLKKGAFLLSFDDGFREIHDIVAPILNKKGVPAIFFVNPAFIDNKQLFYRCKISILIGQLKQNNGLIPVFSNALNCAATEKEIKASLKKINQDNAVILDNIAGEIHYSFDDFLKNNQPFLTTEQLLRLHQKGFTIGAHSVTHPYYALLNEQEQLNETMASINFVRELLGTGICHFSFPHSDSIVSQKVLDNINKQINGLLFGIQNQKAELKNNMLHRFNAERPETGIEALVKGQILLNRIQQITGSYIVKRT